MASVGETEQQEGETDPPGTCPVMLQAAIGPVNDRLVLPMNIFLFVRIRGPRDGPASQPPIRRWNS